MSLAAQEDLMSQAVREIAEQILPSIHLKTAQSTSALSGTGVIEDMAQQAEAWEELVSEVNQWDPIRSSLKPQDEHITQEMTVNEFLDRVQEKWSERLAKRREEST
jgi:hypothetical protein